MIIRLFLKLFFAALLILISADVFYELHLNWISNLIIQLGDDILLLSFALILITGLIFFGKQISNSLKNYFSQTQRAKRHLFFRLSQARYLQRLFIAKKNQILYFAQLKREKIAAQDNKKQVRLLTKAILSELFHAKRRFTELEFTHYQKAIKQAGSQQKIERLLELQHEIFSK